MDGGAWRAAVHGVADSRTRLKRLSSSSTHKIRKEFKHANKDIHQIIRDKKKKKEQKRTSKQIQRTASIMAISTHISMITLNINVLNAPNKRHRVAELIQKQDPGAFLVAW